MSKPRRIKKYEKIKQSPKNVRFDDLIKMYEMFGFEIREGKNNHFVCSFDSYTITVPKPHVKHVKKNYVEDAIELLEEIFEDELFGDE